MNRLLYTLLSIPAALVLLPVALVAWAGDICNDVLILAADWDRRLRRWLRLA